jgi:hypothetical protein
MGRVESKAGWLLSSAFADVLVRSEAAKSLAPLGEVAGSDEVVQMSP